MREQLIQPDRIYSIQRTAQGVVCTVNGEPLALRLDLRNHSPTGLSSATAGAARRSWRWRSLPTAVGTGWRWTVTSASNGRWWRTFRPPDSR